MLDWNVRVRMHKCCAITGNFLPPSSLFTISAVLLLIQRSTFNVQRSTFCRCGYGSDLFHILELPMHMARDINAWNVRLTNTWGLISKIVQHCKIGISLEGGIQTYLNLLKVWRFERVHQHHISKIESTMFITTIKLELYKQKVKLAISVYFPENLVYIKPIL